MAEGYGVSPMRLARALSSDPGVNSHVFFIAEEDTADVMARAMPPGRAHVVLDTTMMPLLFKNIFSEGEAEWTHVPVLFVRSCSR